MTPDSQSDTPADSAQASQDENLENELQARGLNAPRLNPDHIESLIVEEHYHRFDGTLVVVCLLKLKNGFTTLGKSAPVSEDNFDIEIGERIARENAVREIWPLQGYLLKETLGGFPTPLPDPEPLVSGEVTG